MPPFVMVRGYYTVAASDSTWNQLRLADATRRVGRAQALGAQTRPNGEYSSPGNSLS